MIRQENLLAIIPTGWLHGSNVFAACLLLCGTLAAQSLPNGESLPLVEAPVGTGLLLEKQAPRLLRDWVGAQEQPNSLRTADITVAYRKSSAPHDGPLRITLDQAQAQAQAGGNPMLRLAQLQVEAAKQHRLGAQSDYFPKLSSTFVNMHFNKFMGEELTLHGLAGGTATVGVPLVGKDQTLVAVTAAQPLTPLFKLREVVRLAQADENIARVKAGMSVSETAGEVEKNYYDLLVAQRQLVIAEANAESIPTVQLVASNAMVPGEVPRHDVEEIETVKALARVRSKVKEMTATLNLLLGYPADTELELVLPVMRFVEISLKEATDNAIASNPEVVEAEQTVVKARAGSKLSKLDYVPDFELLGGYTYQDNVLPPLPRDFSFIGVLGSYNLFDFGKREHTVKERSAQLSAAELALQLTKAKVGAAVKSSYFELDRSRQLSELAHRMASTVRMENTANAPGRSEFRTTAAKLEVEMLQADLEYRQALARLKSLMGER